MRAWVPVSEQPQRVQKIPMSFHWIEVADRDKERVTHGEAQLLAQRRSLGGAEAHAVRDRDYSCWPNPEIAAHLIRQLLRNRDDLLA